MKVGSSQISSINSERIHKDLNKIKNSEADTTNIPSEDKVEISSKALDLKAMQSEAMASSDVRTEKVDSVKMKVENGTYTISNEKIAERLLDEAME
ncbi:MAG: flagellar biosynthesis anti-sigma factor FlgM [bacterium]|nr:flagellar biosynthesis anti-sigma factor FlgM [bacterium]